MRVCTFIQDGRSVDEVVVDGRPPDSFRAPIAIVPSSDIAAGTVTLQNVPAFDWSYGCSATSAAMVMGYYDNNTYPNLYTGPANGGVCPLTNAVWGSGECPLSATRQGYDGRNLLGHVDDYWRAYNNCDADPYVSAWAEHTQGDCTGDFMGTNQSKYDNCDGATTFYFDTDGSPLHDYTGGEPTIRDGCHGIKLFVQSRGYSVTANFSQYIYGYKGNTTGFTFANYMSEIDLGRPVLIQVSGHTMVGFGYDSANETVYLRDTWDYSSHSMTWGGTYSGMAHYGVTVLRLACTGSNPVITSQPVGATVCAGQSAAFSVTATGGPITYQWRKNSVNIAGATTSSHFIGSAAVSDAGSYSCVVTNACGSTTSSNAALVVNAPPSVTSNPVDQSVYAGKTATFSVDATGSGLTYQWQVSSNSGGTYENVTTGTGGNSASYTTAPTTTCDNGALYRCVVSGTCPPSAVSAPAVLQVAVAIVLLSEGFNSAFLPAGWTMEYETGSVNWAQSVGDKTGGPTAEGAYNAVLYSNSSANHKTYLITPAIEFASCGAPAMLEFWHKQAPTARQDTLEVRYRTSAGGAWTQLASYTSALSQWTKRTIALPGLTSTYYIGFLGNAKGGNGVCIDGVVVVQGCCPIAITSHPSPVTTCAGTNASFYIAASGADLAYQWRKNEADIEGATSPTFAINSVNAGDAGSYDCVVTNTCGSEISTAAVLTVNSGPSITVQPSAVSIWLGGPSAFSVAATGSGTLSYQWRKNGSPIHSATESTFAIVEATLEDEGSYDCVVTNGCGSATSTAAMLTVVTPAPTVSAAKLIPDGHLVALLDMPVTFTAASFFYIEQRDRSSGIRVEQTAHGLPAGGCANLVGILSTNPAGERCIAATAVAGSGAYTIEPIMMGNNALCGGNWHYDSATHAGQRGGTGMLGLNNVGLLVKTWGKLHKNQ